MDSSSFFLTTVLAATIGFFTIFKKLRLHQEEDEETSSPPSSLSPSSSPSSLNRIWTHHVFPSFRGEDVRRDFLSHIQMEFQRMGITPFIDNEIKRGESIGPELIRAIRGSKIAIILLSRNYASSSWCLDELVEIMKCKEELGQIVMVVFYKVDPSDVKKLTGEFGKIFRKTCAGKTKQDTGRWRQALAKVATIAGYHSSNWDNEAAMIKQISTDISNELNNSALSSDFDGLVGMRAHLKKMEPLLCLDSDEVRMIGIWGPSGIGKTTIARVAYNKFSNNFQLSVFMESIEVKYTRPCSDDYSAKLHLQQLFMSQITNQNDMKISHLGVVKDRLKDKKVLVILDGVDQSIQLEAMAKETRWFGPGSRIIITTQNRKIFRTHGINHIYKVDFPPDDEALQIFCTYAFGQKSSKDGFKELAREVTKLAGKLPLGLRVMGSYFRGMSKQEWAKELPRLRTSLDTDIQSILKFSYDALDDEEKYLFLHIACFFNYQVIEKVVTHLSYLLLDARRGLNVLAEKSLISIEYGRVSMHNLLVQLGRDIVRKQSVREPGQRLYLVDGREICEILTDDVGTNRRFIGINFDFGVKSVKKKFSISERAFQGMTNLQFLKLKGIHNTLDLLRGLEYILVNLPSTIGYTKNLQKLNLGGCSSLISLPSFIGTSTNLQILYIGGCSSLVELPSFDNNFISLSGLDLSNLSSLVELPSFDGNFINLKTLNLSRLLNLVELPSFVGNATNLENLDLSDCSSLVKLPFSIGNLQKLQTLILDGCSKLEYLPTDINLESLDILDLTNCLLLKLFPVISTNLSTLHLTGTAIEEVPSSIKSWSRLTDLLMTYSVKLKECPHAFDVITELHVDDKEIQELPPWVNEFSRLQKLRLYGCKKLVSIPQIPDSLTSIVAEDCESLERLDFSFQNPKIYSLNFDKCFKLNQEARDLIIQKQTITYAVLPGGEVPAYFTHRTATGGSLKINLNEKPLPIFMRFKACILLVNEGDNDETCSHVYVTCKNSKMGLSLFATSWIELDDILTEHLYIFEVEMDVISSELIFEFKVRQDDWEIGQCNWKIGQCGVIQLLEVP
ncbi:probable disease resistance protein RPP1 isoform X3 [Capsella rubella]|uniref:probable disease resistance protein RPP1 isoform X3 n=1 Tax=Capsella rubella TaxID=81985 RepID=UPI000CD52ADD|nr:probable disease resistance protein RPP1 isoform X3 [Capsella rubella]